MTRFCPPADVIESGVAKPEPRDRYTVKEIKEAAGVRFVVVFQGQYRFLRKDKGSAQRTADKLNRIRKHRLENW